YRQPVVPRGGGLTDCTRHPRLLERPVRQGQRRPGERRSSERQLGDEGVLPLLRSAGGHCLLHVALGLLLLLPTSVFLTGTVQAAFPEREIRFIVPWAPGGGTDVMARTLQAILEDRGVKIVVDNRPGGSSAVGMAELIQARPDGYTVGVASSTIL